MGERLRAGLAAVAARRAPRVAAAWARAPQRDRDRRRPGRGGGAYAGGATVAAVPRDGRARRARQADARQHPPARAFVVSTAEQIDEVVDVIDRSLGASTARPRRERARGARHA